MTNLLLATLQWGPHRGPHGPMDPHGPMGPHWGGGDMMSFGGWGGGNVGIGFLGPLFWVLMLAVIVLGAVYLMRMMTETTTDQSDRAMELLREQYARGDLSDEEFDNRASRLSQQ